MGKKWVRNDQGIALPLVLAVMAVMTILSVAAFNVSTNQTLLVQKSIDRDEALYAAEQGYNHYLWKLNDDDIFYLDTTEYDCDTSESEFDVYTLNGEETGNYRVQIRVARETVDGIEVPVRNRIVLRSTGCLKTILTICAPLRSWYPSGPSPSMPWSPTTRSMSMEMNYTG